MIVVLMFALTACSPDAAVRRDCQDEARSRLRAPATAEFSDGPDAMNSDLPAVVSDGSTRIYFGAVDAQNGFGALIRNYYVCRSISSATFVRFIDDDEDLGANEDFKKYLELAVVGR